MDITIMEAKKLFSKSIEIRKTKNVYKKRVMNISGGIAETISKQYLN